MQNGVCLGAKAAVAIFFLFFHFPAMSRKENQRAFLIPCPSFSSKETLCDLLQRKVLYAIMNSPCL